jgi:hypothetical protein
MHGMNIKLTCSVLVPDGLVVSHGTACCRDRMKAHPPKDELFFVFHTAAKF